MASMLRIVLLLLLLLLLPVLFRLKRQGTLSRRYGWLVVLVVGVMWIVSMRWAVQLGGKIFGLFLLVTVGAIVVWQLKSPPQPPTSSNK